MAILLWCVVKQNGVLVVVRILARFVALTKQSNGNRSGESRSGESRSGEHRSGGVRVV